MQEKYKQRFFVTGGGTGGHIYPALAVADELSKDSKIYYVGNKRNMEYKLVANKGYKFLHVSCSGMPRKFSIKFIYWGFRLLKSILYSIKYIKKYKPCAVFATGGYVSAPMVIACIITKTPYIMHDCDAMPGLVSRNLSKKAKYVTLAFDKAKKYIANKNTVVTGNPIRSEFVTLTKQDAIAKLGIKNKLTLSVMGGSQGAKSINMSFVELIKELSQEKDLQIIFQTGKKNYDEIVSKLDLLFPSWKDDSNLLIRPYFDDMVSVLKSSDIVISRAGSLSLSEICASGCASIIIPYPYAAANHQRINAKCLLDMGACLCIEDKNLEPNILRQVIYTLLDNPVKIEYLKQNSSNMAKVNATQEICSYLRKFS